ncbi:MarR family winged helix-turn-helix transcriptional regulator [Pseudoteredinibacter isoporae]|uniref:DNA-binding MarR family transcriptional regulator n=1 Tax=Pseudoteredinibacter isoporae TaxID=570281 RepID=A0A7X0MWE9_9GAMM|nr:MarR family transcriptional regulator [Pseudoteredinibacter isoporae]MBB6522408.1 DNA-binding MarR family transcriptional regulator [Pseudoteredinibacter isoporae]NHO87941.1 MarR family transcriptional regulator [Pseudoteredinibacter isoporae]NIB23728.1 MarR family transcriptional regulator [Pseudoteredinibacter isoporae]
MSSDKYLRVWLQLAKSSKSIEQEMETRFHQRFKQSMSRFDVLSQLYRYSPEGLPMGKVAEQLLASRGNITRLVDRMVNEHLIERSASPLDRRVIQIRITEKGLQLFEEMAQAHADWSHELLGDLTPLEIDQLLHLLKRANSAFKVATEPE